LPNLPAELCFGYRKEYIWPKRKLKRILKPALGKPAAVDINTGAAAAPIAGEWIKPKANKISDAVSIKSIRFFNTDFLY
jgi:hypothetical protein